MKEADISLGVSVFAVNGNKCSRLAHHVANSLAAFANNKADGFARNGNRYLVNIGGALLLYGSGLGLGSGGLGGGGLRGGRCFRLVIISWVRRS